MKVVYFPLKARAPVVWGMWLACTPLLCSATPVDYAREIKPLLRDHCYACHGAIKQQGALRLDTAAAARRGGETGPAIEPGNDQESLLIQVVTGSAGFQMPPEGKGKPLSAEEIDLLRRWIREGAPAPAHEEVPVSPQEHWSYRVPQRPPLPVVSREGWVRTPIDAFLAARHEALGLVPQCEAGPAVWLRRVYLDLIGLPPTPSELAAFVADHSPQAYERVVDELLGRPEYGERWGRHWMDVWRYSDWYGSRGINEIRYSQRHIWRWRDWIVQSLNADKGYDRMIVEMLAGDEIAAGDPDVSRATGFLGRNWYKFDRNVWMFETVEQTAQAFLGVTMRCCRCHDHKYEPISQEEYYRFRAFFEPHDVRTDPLNIGAATEKDATLGQVLKDGVARVYDKQLDAPTYLFQRGDDRYPDEEHPLSPGVPAIFGGDAVDVQVVQLAPREFYPSLREPMLSGLAAQAEAGVVRARESIQVARDAAEVARREYEQLSARVAAGELDGQTSTTPFLVDEFAERRDDVWKIVNGEWVYEEGHLIEKAVGSFHTIVTTQDHPRDFRATITYRALVPGTYRSVGCSFDYVDQGNSQDVYTSTGDASQSVQAFHRQDGKQVYPQAGIVKTSLKVGEPATLEFEARGSQLTIWLNGEKKLDYTLPVARREGKFALWVHAGSAEFLKLDIQALSPTLADLKRKQSDAERAIQMAQKKLLTTEAERTSLHCRIEAEKAKYLSATADAGMAELAIEASRAERRVNLAKAEEEVLLAEQQLQTLLPAPPNRDEVGVVKPAAGDSTIDPTKTVAPNETPETPAISEARKKLADALAARDMAADAVQHPDGSYSPLGEMFPATSTGRRLALARWMTSSQNPRSARVAVNQIWLKHFGQALVPTVANFGLGGESPIHPELLDWLAVEFMENGWSMKHMHRLMVLSNTYRMSSSSRSPGEPAGVSDGERAGPSAAELAHNVEVDPGNRYQWRMNSRRMEAEVIRDSILSVAGSLDSSRGGPEIPESQGQTNARRSVYFRNTPNEKMQLLELFDMANPNECYRRRESVVPQQALALMNSGLALDQSRLLAEELTRECGHDNGALFVQAAFTRILNRSASREEQQACLSFLAEHAKLVVAPETRPFAAGGQSQRPPSTNADQRAREDLVHVLFSHNDFITIR